MILHQVVPRYWGITNLLQEEKINALMLCSRIMSIIGYQKHAIKYYQHANKLLGMKPMEKNTIRKIAIIHCYIGQIQRQRGDYKNALLSFNRALPLWKKINERGNYQKALGDIGSTYSLKKNYKSALSFHHRALKLAMAIKDKREIQNSLICIGNIFIKKNQPVLALSFFKKATPIAKKIGDKINEAILYSSIGSAYLILEKMNFAKIYLQKALSIGTLFSNNRILADIYGNWGRYYFLLKDFKESLKFYDLAQRFASSAEDRYLIEQIIKEKNKVLTAVSYKVNKVSKNYLIRRKH